MNYKAQTTITKQLFKEAPIDDEYMYRDLARKLVTDMPLELLKKLIHFRKSDPDSKELKEKLTNPYTPDWEKDWIQSLIYQQVILFEAKIETF